MTSGKRFLRRIGRALPTGSYRALLGGALDTVGVLERLLWLRAKSGVPFLTVLTYHRIADLADVGELDLGVAEASATELEEQIAVIKAHCVVVSIGEVRRWCKSRIRLPRSAALLSFDDGYLDNHATALPILLRAAVPATFFIPTSFPEAGRLFWWDRVALLIHRCRRPRVELTYPAITCATDPSLREGVRSTLVLEPMRAPEAAVKRFCRVIKRTPGVDLDRALEALERGTGVTLSPDEERRLAAASIMSWSHVRALRRAGMDVQSHSHSHRVLDTLSPDEAVRDLARSRRVLSEVLEEPVHTVAYPVGYRIRGPFRRAVEEAGFDLGFTNASGLCATSRFDPLNIPRLAMDRRQVGALFKLKLLGADGAVT